MANQATPPTGLRSIRVALWTVAVSALASFAAVYAWLAPSDNAGGPRSVVQAYVPPAAASTPASAEAPAELPKGPGDNPLSVGQMAAFVFKPAPEPIADIAFTDGEGKPRTFADWKGRVVLLNLWATWCAPCRKEMPALDRLQKELGSDKFEVVALAIDRGGIDKARQFLSDIKVERLGLYVDATAKLTAPLKVVGLPTTILIKDGQEIGRLVGPAEWDTPEAKALITATLR